MNTGATLDATLRLAPVVPVIVVDDAAQAAALGRTLVGAGLPVLEVTLRTVAGFAAIERMLAEVEGAVVGAGTVTTTAEVARLARLGARFIVSPGLTARLVAACADAGLPILPGVMTVSELMLGGELGLRHFKFFPAANAGGPPMLRAWAAPFPDVWFCPTGGVTAENVAEYLAVPTVLTVGMTWVAPRDLVTAARWDEIGARAARAAGWKRPATAV